MPDPTQQVKLRDMSWYSRRTRASDRHHVARRAVCRIHGAEDVIEEGALVELGVADVGLAARRAAASA